MNSKMFFLNHKDLLKGLFMFVGSSALATLYSLIQNKGFDLAFSDLRLIGVVSATSFLTYILKQLGTDENNKLVGKV